MILNLLQTSLTSYLSKHVHLESWIGMEINERYFFWYGHVIFTSGSDLDPGLGPIEGLGGGGVVSFSYVSDKVILQV